MAIPPPPAPPPPSPPPLSASYIYSTHSGAPCVSTPLVFGQPVQRYPSISFSLTFSPPLQFVEPLRLSYVFSLSSIPSEKFTHSCLFPSSSRAPIVHAVHNCSIDPHTVTLLLHFTFFTYPLLLACDSSAQRYSILYSSSRTSYPGESRSSDFVRDLEWLSRWCIDSLCLCLSLSLSVSFYICFRGGILKWTCGDLSVPHFRISLSKTTSRR